MHLPYYIVHCSLSDHIFAHHLINGTIVGKKGTEYKTCLYFLHNSETILIQRKIEGYSMILTPWCRVLLEKLTGLQLVKKFNAHHGTRRFITAPTSVRHLSLSWASPIQSVYPHPTSWRSIIDIQLAIQIRTILDPYRYTIS